MVHFRSPRSGTECYIINRFIWGGISLVSSIWVGIITVWFVGMLLFALGIAFIWWGVSEFLEFDTKSDRELFIKGIPRHVKWHLPPIRPDLDFERIIEKNRDNSDANVWYFLGKERLAKNNFAGAITALKRALDLEPRFPAAWFALGDSYLAFQKPQEAKEALKKGLQIDSGNMDYLAKFGKALEMLGEKEKAQQVYDEVDKYDSF